MHTHIHTHGIALSIRVTLNTKPFDNYIVSYRNAKNVSTSGFVADCTKTLRYIKLATFAVIKAQQIKIKIKTII